MTVWCGVGIEKGLSRSGYCCVSLSGVFRVGLPARGLSDIVHCFSILDCLLKRFEIRHLMKLSVPVLAKLNIGKPVSPCSRL